ncbi:MAG: xanthine dehydrogenase molybdopterin binding subunit [Ideonella sp.]|nr:xanthine dehydrogenase molybdopterin binding subunit [Ideonella sp.]MCC7455711.1 xanthine dehydrogenase molybdopterin binding subunit [Nitrospira sp.]
MNKPHESALLDAPASATSTARAAAERHDAGVGVPHPHESAHLHVAGEATYVDDMPELAGTLHAALGLSPLAHGRLKALALDAIRAQPGVVEVLAAADIPGSNDCGPIEHDDPILADGTVHYLGQPMFVVLAHTREAARRAAAGAKQAATIEPLPPVLTPREAHRLQQYVIPPMHMSRGDAQRAIAAAPHRLHGSLSIGGQEQFYLEGQIAYAIPLEDDGMLVHCSTQHPSEMQHAVAHALDMASHRVRVECRRMGGGFGGKESQSALFACVAAVAARHTGRPVKLRPDRDDDFLVTGRRHGFEYDYSVGYDDDGRVLGAEIDLISNAGFSADLSGPVMTRALCHFDNAYWLPHVAMHGYSARTNTQSNTAFRGFGGPQGAIAIESILESIARALGKDSLAVRRVNFYGPSGDAGPGGGRNVTPYGQVIDDNVIEALVERLVRSSDYERRRRQVAEFNAASPVLKRGLALTPVKFGISFNVAHFNQAGALVHVYTDGSVLVNHGGTEMGQGLNTKVAQVVAHELGLPLTRVRCTAADTQKVANTSATAASTGADLNGMAGQDAARQIRDRLAAFAAPRLDVRADEVHFADGAVHGGGQRIAFDALVREAYAARVQLWSDGFYATPGLHWNRDTLQGHPFFYFAYGAAVSEVVVDTLTGESRLLRADVLHDVGRSLNPAIDLGQIEGAFIQGMGWLTTEELKWHPSSGLLMTHAPSTYKIPTANDCPPVFNVELFEADNVADSVHRSKAVGEPPLLLPFSVFFAIRDAVSAVGGHRADPPLRAPATAEAVLDAITAVREATKAAA